MPRGQLRRDVILTGESAGELAPPGLSACFTQLFAWVVNPPLDAVRGRPGRGFAASG